MEILPVNELDIALHDFVSKDDKLAFYSCLQYNLDETRNKLNAEADKLKFEEEDIILKVGECMQERVKERSLHSKENMRITSGSRNLQDNRGRITSGSSSMNSFSDEEDTRQMLSISKSADRGKKILSGASTASHDASDPGKRQSSRRGTGRVSSSLKQMTLDATMKIRQSERLASASASPAVRSIVEEEVDFPSSEETEGYEINEVANSSEPEETVKKKGRKRAAPRGRGRGSTSSAKRGRKSDSFSIHSMSYTDDDDMSNRLKKTQPRVTRNYGAVRKR